MSENAGLDIQTGGLTAHQSDGSTGNVLHPYDVAEAPAVMPPTQIVPGQLSGPTVPALDTTGMQQQQMAAGEADVRAAQGYAESAENDRRAGYQAQMLPEGSSPYQIPDMPTVPEDAPAWGSANAASQGYLYGPGGDQPGRDPGNTGNQPD